ncbi:MAG: hypothetical protein H6706_26895 [Myxococcales bacterium]|nr:hypothetical protein [Myxococcales bacterium]
MSLSLLLAPGPDAAARLADRLARTADAAVRRDLVAQAPAHRGRAGHRGPAMSPPPAIPPPAAFTVGGRVPAAVSAALAEARRIRDAWAEAVEGARADAAAEVRQRYGPQPARPCTAGPRWSGAAWRPRPRPSPPPWPRACSPGRSPPSTSPPCA